MINPHIIQNGLEISIKIQRCIISNHFTLEKVLRSLIKPKYQKKIYLKENHLVLSYLFKNTFHFPTPQTKLKKKTIAQKKH